MKTNKPAVSLLCLFLLMLPVDLMENSDASTSQGNGPSPLNMQDDSVDDMYSTCKDEMEKKVNDEYFKNEFNSELFKKAWTSARQCTERDLKSKDPEDEALTENHLRAICVYTGGVFDFYEKFNEVVKTERNSYGSTFPFHFLHFWLTTAVQILNKNKECHTTYRRSKSKYTGKVNDEIRFGTFTSSSKLSDLTRFGHTTCFKITTCYGAFLKKYPRLKDKEQEVLIPPYEKFKITKECGNEKCKWSENLADCETVYVLKSTGVQSNLDCQLVKCEDM